MASKKLEQLAVNTIRALVMDGVQKANSGHPGLPLGAAPMAYVLWTRFLQHSPANPQWFNRDRFVLSAGHGSALLYSILHLAGRYSTDDLRSFRQWESPTPGHPERDVLRGVENTSGPLGQGHAMAVGAAIVERFLAARFGEWLAHKTFVYVSDGAIQEEITSKERFGVRRAAALWEARRSRPGRGNSNVT